ncbi:MAG TPA: hypothetical protein VKU19_09860 [Bryobacteraceae bacterium]|nr:hypothetical protein [Bryobacteraceae bacterium]
MRESGFDPEALLLGYTAGELTSDEKRRLFEAAAYDQNLFDQLMEAETVRHALSFPEERGRASAVLQAWENTPEPADSAARPDTPATLVLRGWPNVPQSLPPMPASAGVDDCPRAWWPDLLRSVVSTVATTIALRLCYAVLTAIGSSFVTGSSSGESFGTEVPPVPSILHLVHAAIAALLLGVQFTPFLRPQAIGERDHPIARKCLAQFIVGWRWAWVAWLALYGWLWTHAGGGVRSDAIADVLNCLTSFPLFWCFFVLDKPSVAVPGDPQRTVSFRKAIGTVWGIGAGVAVLAAAGRLHLWGLNEFGLVFQGIYNGLAIAFLVGRFDSHWMKVPRWMLAPLYGYALIQMIYVFFFSLPPAWQVYTYLVALLFKVCLFLVVTHLLHAGNLRQYLEAAEDGKLGPDRQSNSLL